MNEEDNQFKAELIEEILGSNMSFEKKVKVMKMLDNAFRKYMGGIYLSNKELEERDILFRSM